MTSPIEKLTKLQLLDLFQEKAACFHSQEKATSVIRLLKPSLTQDHYQALMTTWSYYRKSRLGRGEIDSVCNSIRQTFI